MDIEKKVEGFERRYSGSGAFPQRVGDPILMDDMTEWIREALADAFEEGRTHGYDIAKMELEKRV